MRAIMETAFDIAYFACALWLSAEILRNARGRGQYRLFGAMGLILVFGDAFHLVPRMAALNSGAPAAFAAQMGLGKLITSVTATVFYALFYHAWRARYQVKGRHALTAWVWLLTLARVALCLFPQNDWTGANPPLAWGVYRNLPFLPLGAIVMALMYASGRSDPPMKRAWLAILLSFLFYIPVVLFADAAPAVGMLMIPKTLAYVWLLFMARAAERADGGAARATP